MLKKPRSLFFLTLAMMITISGVLVSPGKGEAAIRKSFSEPVDLGEPVQQVSIFDSAYGIVNGHNIMYTTSVGSPAVFNVIDLTTNTLIKSIPLPGVHDSWAHVTAPDGTVYIGTAAHGKLFRYFPETKQIKDLGEFAGQRKLYDLSVDEEGNVYGGTYPGGKVFQYNPDTGEFRDYGQMVEGQEYVRATAYYEGYLYASVGGQEASLIKLNVETGVKTEIPLPDSAKKVTSFRPLDVVGHYLFANIGGTLFLYDLIDKRWENKEFTVSKTLRMGEAHNNNAYFFQEGKLIALDLTTLETKDTGVRYGSTLRNAAWIEVEGDPDLPDMSLVTVSFTGNAVYMNPQTDVTKTVEMPVEGQPVPIRDIEKGPDGAIYLSGYPGGEVAKYDPSTGETIRFSMNQVEGMTPLGNKLYMGTYPNAGIYELDVTEPVEPGVNPKKLFAIEGEDRPFAMTTGAGKVYIGTIPDYGDLGGALTIYNPETGERQVFHDVVYNQSIVGLAYKDGLLYGSTSIDGGEGIDPTEDAAKMFVWDLATNKKIAEFVPELPNASATPTMISGLTIGPDGLLWAAADGIVFAIDPETYEVVKSKVIYPEITNFGKWRPVSAEWGKDGLLYMTLGRNLTVINPDTLEHVTLGGSAVMTMGDDGNIYYRGAGSDRTHLKMIQVSEGVTIPNVNVPILLENPGFEQAVTDGEIPGWELLYKTDQTTYGVSQEQSKSGEFSLKLRDEGRNKTVAVGSDNIKVQPGVEYIVNAHVFLQSGRTILSLVFYDENGKQVKKESTYIRSKRGQWQSVHFRAVAPDSAAYAKVVPFCSQYWRTTAYYDDFSISYQLEAEMVDVPFIHNLIQQFAASGKLEKPLTNQLTNRLNQAQHHHELGHQDQAVKHLNDFLKHLNNPVMKAKVTKEAKEILEAADYYLIQKWSK